MNVLYIGPYRQLDAWGDFSYNFVKSLCKNKEYNVTLRPIFLARGMGITHFPEKLYDAEIISGENRLYDSYDMVIQHCLPTLFVQNGDFKKNVGLFHYDSRRCSTYDLHTKLMDELWLPTTNQIPKETQIDKWKNVGIATCKEPNSQYKPDENFRFYTIAEDMSDKSGLPQLLLAFLNAFTAIDNVTLDLYTTQQSVQPLQQLIQRLIDVINKHKSRNLYPPIRVIVVNSYESLHTGDCYISPGLISSIDYGAIHALLNKKTPVMISGTLMEALMPKEHIWSVPAYEDTLIEQKRPLHDLFTVDETWQSPIVFEFEEVLRQVVVDQQSKQGNLETNPFSIEAQAQKLKELIC